MEIKLLTEDKEQPFLILAKQAAEFIIRNNEHVFENNLQVNFSSYDNCYVSYNKSLMFTFSQERKNTKYIFMFFRIMTKKGKLLNAQQINVIDIENNTIYELNNSIEINEI